MKQGVWIVPPDNLQAAQAESDYFVELNRLQWQVALNGPLGTTFDVEDKFSAGETQLFHFACHGNFSATNPDDSKLKLADDNLTPGSLSGRRGGGLRRARPLVFLNACHSGRVGAGPHLSWRLGAGVLRCRCQRVHRLAVGDQRRAGGAVRPGLLRPAVGPG